MKRAGKITVTAVAALFVLAVWLMVTPTLEGLSLAGQRALAITMLAIGLWIGEILPVGVTGMLVILSLMVSGAVSNFQEALIGFAKPVPYFLMAVLTIGLAVSKSGLAERIAGVFLRSCKGRPKALYIQMLLSFPLLTLLLPSATTRTGILIHVYERVLNISGVAKTQPLSKAIMMALNSINRLASTALLTGGITPVVAAALVGGMSWSRWLSLMLIPYMVLLMAGAVLIYLLYRQGFKGTLPQIPQPEAKPLSKVEIRTIIITLGASLLWLTDAIHHLNPSIPALLAWICLLSPGIGVLSWREFEQHLGWAIFFVIASSMSLAHALIESGAGIWLGNRIVGSIPAMSENHLAVVLVLLLAAVPVRLLIPNITGFLGISVPIAMAIGMETGLNPVACGLIVMIAGDAVLYYPAQTASSLVIYGRGHLSAAEIFRFGLFMTIMAFVVVMAVVLPYWNLIGFTLVQTGGK